MYRKKPSEPMIDTETGMTFVAQPFLHFKDTHKFDISNGVKVTTLSCYRVSGVDFRANAHLFGEPETVSETTPTYSPDSINSRCQSGKEIEMSGPERQAAFNEVLPVLGRMLLRFEDCSSLFIAPSFPQDYFKSFPELQTEALRHKLEWAHTYILQSRILMERFNLDTLAKVRSKLKLDPEPGEDKYDFEDRIEEAIASFAPGDYFFWLGWAEDTPDSVSEGVRELLRLNARARNIRAYLFANLLEPKVILPEQVDYVTPRFKALQPELLTTEERQ